MGDPVPTLTGFDGLLTFLLAWYAVAGVVCAALFACCWAPTLYREGWRVPQLVLATIAIGICGPPSLLAAAILVPLAIAILGR